jgi:hypothetical protein
MGAEKKYVSPKRRFREMEFFFINGVTYIPRNHYFGDTLVLFCTTEN